MNNDSFNRMYPKPPLGLKPRFLHDEQRLDDLREAIIRRIELNVTVQIPLIEEYNELIIKKQGE